MSWIAAAVWYAEGVLRWLAGAALWALVFAIATAPIWLAFAIGRCTAP